MSERANSMSSPTSRKNRSDGETPSPMSVDAVAGTPPRREHVAAAGGSHQTLLQRRTSVEYTPVDSSRTIALLHVATLRTHRSRDLRSSPTATAAGTNGTSIEKNSTAEKKDRLEPEAAAAAVLTPSAKNKTNKFFS